MPLIEYNCESCSTTKELLFTHQQRVDADDSGVYCDDCGEQMHHVYSRPAAFPVGKYGKGGGQ